jgi:cyclohexanecarboxylate-CoA ligase
MSVRLPAVPASRRELERHGQRWLERFVDDYLSAAAAQTPDTPAVIDGPHCLSYAKADRRIAATAASLQDLGVTPGEVVSWQLPNWHEAYLLHQAILRIGAVSNPIVPIYRQRELTYILSEAGSRVFVIPESFRGFSYAAMAAELRPALPALEHVVVCRPAGSTGPADFADLSAGSRQPRAVNRSPDDPVLLLFTSGTTAQPKGVIHTHNTLDYENRSIIEVFGLSTADVVFMPSPVSHITGLLYGLQLPAMLGTTVVFQDIWDPRAALRQIGQHGCTFTVAATPFLHGLTYHPELPPAGLPTLRAFACGGADVPPALIYDARDRLGCVVTRIYGSTEFPTLSACGPDDPAVKAATTDGRPIGAAQCRVVDPDDDRILPAGQVGELLVTGPELFLGYLRPDDDAGSFTPDGWFRTGDLAVCDPDGYVTIRGRKKDIILRGGENISVAEVEDLLFEHPLVAEVAIVAMPDPVMVERACAFVVPADGAAPTLDDLAGYLIERQVARQKIPERLVLVAMLPKTQSGKVQKFRLRQVIRDTLAREQPAVEAQ